MAAVFGAEMTRRSLFCNALVMLWQLDTHARLALVVRALEFFFFFKVLVQHILFQGRRQAMAQWATSLGLNTDVHVSGYLSSGLCFSFYFLGCAAQQAAAFLVLLSDFSLCGWLLLRIISVCLWHHAFAALIGKQQFS